MVKTLWFVAVRAIAIDLRYTTLALEQQYKGIYWIQSKPASGVALPEKIL